jgi:acetolactate synthase-1/2/3 large subunit
MATVAEQVVKTLSKAGVRYIFGIPGGPSIPYMDAMRRERIEFVLVANEASAGIMADVCARITGVPGVCHATFGPGATNLTTGVGCAYLDRSSLLAFTTEQSDDMQKRITQMNIDHQALFAPITKWTTRLQKDTVVETIEKALLIALSEVPGPVHIGLPADIADAVVPDKYDFSGITVSPVPLPRVSVLERAERSFQNARKPLLAVGLTAARLKLNHMLTQFAQKQKVPVVLTPMAKGMLPENHPCYAGVLFHARSQQIANIYRQADLVLGIGYDPIEFNYEAWMPNVPLVHIDVSPVDIDPDYAVACDVCGRLEHSLGYLLEIPESENDWDLEELHNNRQILLGSLKPKNDLFDPIAALDILRKVLPPDGIMTCDVGAHTHLIGQHWRTPAPGLQIMTNGWSSMGFAIPSAIAAKLCLPGRAVCCVTGDGGFLMMAGEIITARRLKLNIVFVILVDQELSLIRVKEEWRACQNIGTRLFDDDFLGADRFFGVLVLTVKDANEMENALAEGFSGDEPCIVEAVIDGSKYSDLIERRYK